MDKTLLKNIIYFLVILGGVLNLQANTLPQQDITYLDTHVPQEVEHDSLILPLSGHSSLELVKILTEITENEEIDHNADNDNLSDNILSIVFFYNLVRYELLNLKNPSYLKPQPLAKVFCKKYIQFEVFRI